MESMKETINQLIQTATDNNVTNCDEVFEVTKPSECISELFYSEACI